MKKHIKENIQYSLDHQGRFLIENYNEAKPFSNFFPGIAGVWGIPMWAFYVNRGQCISSFGIESKDKAILEFQPANKAYRVTSLQGFRTFIKVTSGTKSIYWEPFQNQLLGTEFKKKQNLSIGAHDLTLEETNFDLGLKVTVNYFTLPEENYAGLVRRVSIQNLSNKKYKVEVVDGLPLINSYGLKDWLAKNMSRTVEAWIKVRNLKKMAPYYQLNVEVSDKPEVTHIKDGNFFFSFDATSTKLQLLNPIVEAANVFGSLLDFAYPAQFVSNQFTIKDNQQTSNRTPSAMSYAKFDLASKKERKIVSFFGYAHSEDQVNKIVKQALVKGFIDQKAKRNEEIIQGIKDFAFTNSASKEWDLYTGHTFLDNILRGGVPVSLKTGQGQVAFNVYSRKHGDPERDYNFFVVSPTYFSQGNGNYRDVNQNRRNDVWFNKDVKDQNIISFFSLIQADGYNPLIVKGTSFQVNDFGALEKLLAKCVNFDDVAAVKNFLLKDFQPGALLQFILQYQIKLNVPLEKFLGSILEISDKQELAEHGEGFWVDHWTYNLDLVESYLAKYPEELRNLLLGNKNISFFHDHHHVFPRNHRYILTPQGVRQYHSVGKGHHVHDGNKLRTNHGKGEIYQATLLGKILCLIATKAATLDPSGIGIEMEADKPSWYDALNGLPGLLGSSISETIELKRMCVFLKDAIDQLKLDENKSVAIYEELVIFIRGLMPVLQSEIEPLSYWMKSNDLKEVYRHKVLDGIHGKEVELRVSEIKELLKLVIKKTNCAIKSAKNDKGFLSTYFAHEVTSFQASDKHHLPNVPYVMPKAFKIHFLPLFLEGYVHAFRALDQSKEAIDLYHEVRRSALFDKKLKMYKVNANLTSESEDIGRTRIFPRGWLENESIWLHMEYKLILEFLRNGLYREFFENLKQVGVPFLKPEIYGRSILENSSFIASSAHEDEALHGQGFVARLSGSTAELLHMWLLMNVGKTPFRLNVKDELSLHFEPALPASFFTTQKSVVSLRDAHDQLRRYELAANTYAFNFLGSTLVVYHNPNRVDTFDLKRCAIKNIQLNYFGEKKSVEVVGGILSANYAKDVRDGKVERIDIFLTTAS